MKTSRFSATLFAASAMLLVGAAAPAVQAQQLTIGSPNVAVADAVVPPPPAKPCVVTLYTNEQFPAITARLDNHRIATATRSPYPTPTSPTNSSQDFKYSDPFGTCYSRTITAAMGATWPSVLTSVTDGVGCPWDVNSLSWREQFSDFASREFGATVNLLP